MTRLGALIICLGVTLIALGVRTELTAGDPEHAKPPKTGRPAAAVRTTTPTPPAVSGADPDGTYQLAAVITYLNQLEQDRKEREQIAAYLDALEQTRLAAVAEAARMAATRQAATPQPPSRGTSSSSTVTGQCGGATNGADQYIARESGGNPGIYNAGGSGAWGCYQIMPGTWQSSCADLGAYGTASPAQQAACASRLPLSAWGG